MRKLFLLILFITESAYAVGPHPGAVPVGPGYRPPSRPSVPVRPGRPGVVVPVGPGAHPGALPTGQPLFQSGYRRGPFMGSQTGSGWMASGNGCSNNDVTVLENGQTFSILFNSFAINMNEGSPQDGQSVSIFCDVRLNLTPPPGQRIVGFTQTFSGSIMKSTNSLAMLNVQYLLSGRRVSQFPLMWQRGQGIGAESDQSHFAVTLRNDAPTTCNGSQDYGMRMDLTATRDDIQRAYVLAGVDSLDGEFALQIQPLYAPCY